MAHGFLPGKAFMRRWGQAVVAGYLIIGTFGAAYLVTVRVDATVAVAVGVLAAAPLAVAFVWDRLTSVKAFGFEVSLTSTVVDVEPALEEELETELMEAFHSGKEDILKKISEALRRPAAVLMEINLRSEAYWWSTRLYLLAALLDDHSQVQRLVFVHGDNRREYVGMATPREVRRAMAKSNPALETRYREVVTKLAEVQPPEADQVKASIYQWTDGLFSNVPEDQAMELLNADSLRSTVGPRLETVTVADDGPEGPLLYFRILDQGVEFVPIVNDGRLKHVVDANALARQQSLGALERVLDR